MPAIDPTLAVGGAGANEFSIGPVEGLGAEGATAPGTSAEGSRFGGALADQIGKLEALQADAATASRDLAAGTATDPAATVMTIERARLSMQLAAQIRTKGVEALQDIFHTTV